MLELSAVNQVKIPPPFHRPDIFARARERDQPCFFFTILVPLCHGRGLLRQLIESKDRGVHMLE